MKTTLTRAGIFALVTAVGIMCGSALTSANAQGGAEAKCTKEVVKLATKKLGKVQQVQYVGPIEPMSMPYQQGGRLGRDYPGKNLYAVTFSIHVGSNWDGYMFYCLISPSTFNKTNKIVGIKGYRG